MRTIGSLRVQLERSNQKDIHTTERRSARRSLLATDMFERLMVMPEKLSLQSYASSLPSLREHPRNLSLSAHMRRKVEKVKDSNPKSLDNSNR